MTTLNITLEAENIWLSLDIIAEGEYNPGSNDVRSMSCPNGYPGDPECIEHLKVYIERSNDRVEITRVLSPAQLDKITAEMIEASREERSVS